MDYRDSHTSENKGRQYDLYYETDPWQAFMWSRERDRLDDILCRHFRNREIHLLDFACGTGRISGFLESRVTSSVGIDVSEEMLKVASHTLKRTELVKADLTREKALAGQQFNLITAFRFFTNAESDLRQAAMVELVGHLKDDGLLIFNNHHVPGSLYFRLARIWQRIRGHSDNPRSRMMSVNETMSLAESNGMRIVETHPVGFLHVPGLLLPLRLIKAVETLAGRMHLNARLAESIIVVCAHQGSAPDG